ncbi:hypothetical protein ACHQM5_025314 [Ranunculus cassubicifolius]
MISTPLHFAMSPSSSAISPFYNTQSHTNLTRSCCSSRMITRMMSDRSKNRKPLQRGRNLSIEAIQTVQALKRAANANNNNEIMVQQVFDSKFRRLLKLDMIAVLRELLRQNQLALAFQVFEDVRKEYWYRPQLLLYVDMIKTFASSNSFEKLELIIFHLKVEIQHVVATTEDFNALFKTLMDFGFITHAMDCFELTKEVQCQPDESTFKILVCGLESKGETRLSSILRQEAEKYLGWPLESLELEGEVNLSCH